MNAEPTPKRDPRVIALRNFAVSISVLNIAGYAFLGFEQAFTWPLIALAVAYSTELTLETIKAASEKRPPRFLGNGLRGLVEYLYPAHITALAVNMLIYVNDRVLVMIFGVMVAISGKFLLQAPVAGKMRHFMNPSNFGLTVVLLLFPWVSIAPPYQFTEYLFGWTDWIIPVVIVTLGTLLNGKLTKRMWLIAGWLGGFVVQSVVRGLVLDNSTVSALSTMTGVAFILFTNYMITDPGTTPSGRWSQLAFGGGVAAVYGAFTGAGIVYGLFFATATVCLIRGAFLWSLHLSGRSRQAELLVAPPDAVVTISEPAPSNGREAVRT
ncbi:enediyne biosynthesis protein [Virgisporangium ochraceum]|uniref:enediyne biosynthesis protein n=1 Tax=Virgisporangium ochraceum TaxID=65505 RepID=UPI0019424658|nr:enediyne biosynthesis protein [Virgisporangium ochraceum]